jgi:Mg2+/citrate symporter
MSQVSEETKFPIATSSQNTTIASQPGDLIVQQDPEKQQLANAVASLEAELESVQTARKRERFYWIIAIMVLFLVTFSNLVPWYVWTAIFPLSILFLVGMAVELEVPWIVSRLERLFDRFHRSKPKQETE